MRKFEPWFRCMNIGASNLKSRVWYSVALTVFCVVSVPVCT